MTDCAIGVDIGGTKCAAGIVQLKDGQVVSRQRFPTQPQQGGQAVLNRVIGCIESLLSEVSRLDLRLTSIGLGLAELVGPQNQIRSRATIDWIDLDVDHYVSSRFHVPVAIDADVRAAARAEAYWGAGQQANPFLYVTVGTGISASLVIDRHPYLGARGLTGTFASSRQLIPGDDQLLATGPPLEFFAAGPSLADRYRMNHAEFAGQAPEVLQRAEQGNAVAMEVVQSAGRALGAAVAHLVNIVDPEAIVLGGGLGLVLGTYRQACEMALREFIWSDLHRNLPLLSAALGDDAGWIGAALHAAHRTSSY